MERITPDGEGRIVGLGEHQEVTPHRMRQGATRLDAEAAYAEKSHTHLWLVILTHKAGDTLLDHQDGTNTDLPILDTDTLMGPPMVACYVCETAYDPRLRRRRCPGPRD